VVVALAVVFLRERIFPGQYMGLAASLLGILTLSF
jgi:drug/metabolite transporter (DMT)-like permease